MADRDLTNILDKRAAFGANFLGTTNLAQRRRYQEDIEAAEVNRRNMRQERLGAAMEAAELEDPVKVGRLRLDMQQERRIAEDADENLLIRENQFNIRQQMQEEAMALRERQAMIAERRELRSIRDAQRIEDQTFDVEEADFELRELGVLPGSREYASAMWERLVRNPYAKPELRRAIMQQARIDGDPEELQAQAAAVGIKSPKLTGIQRQDGSIGWSIREGAQPSATREVDPDKQRMDMISRFDEFTKRAKETEQEWRQAVKDKSKNADALKRRYEYFNGLAAGAEARMFEFEKPKAAPVATATTPATPAAPAEKIPGKKYRDAAGNVRVYLGEGKWSE